MRCTGIETAGCGARQRLCSWREAVDGARIEVNQMTARREPIEYANASAEVRAVYDDIMATRKTDWVNNFWKVLAHDPATLRRVWNNIKQVMGPGAIDPLTKEMLYLAVSASNGCEIEHFLGERINRTRAH